MIASRMAATATIPIFNSDQASDRVLGIYYSEGLRPSDSLHALSRAASSARSVRVARFASLARVFLRPTRPPQRTGPSVQGGRGARFAPLARVFLRRTRAHH